MKKKILTLLYVLILHSNAYSASEPQLPPPLPSSEEVINSENKGNSFWNKTLNFFGLGNKKQENKKVSAQEKQAEKTADDLGYKNNNTADVNSESPAKTLTAITKELPNSPSAPNSDNVLINNKNQSTDKSSLQKVPDISDLKLPDGIKPDDELPTKPEVATSNNSAPNSPPLSGEGIKKETKTDTSDLQLPDGIKPDDELPTKPEVATSNNSAPNSPPLTGEGIKKETKTDTSDLQLPDGVKPDDELPTKPEAIANKTSPLNASEASDTTSKNTPVQNITLSVPTTDDKSANNNKALTVNTPPIPDTPAKNANSKNNPPLPATGNLLEPKTDKLPENVKLTQDSVAQSSQNSEALNVKTYRQHLQDRLNKTQKLPEISKEDLNPVPATEEANPDQTKFVNDEAQVLILPNDEVVLGEVTKESQLDLMDLNSYLKIFWNNYNSIKNEPARQAINNFIENYDANFNKPGASVKNENMDALSEAFKAVDKNNIYDLINLLDGYPIIQLVDCDGNTLLHKAVYKNNYSAVKFLIMKGIDLSIKNNQGVTALEIAVLQNRPEIETLLRSAGAK